MNIDEHARHLGGLVGNLHSLEFILRGFLNRLPGARPLGVPEGSDWYSAPVGTDLPENDITSFDTLGQLIAKFNAEMNRCGLPELDPSIVELRDALAHGRVSAARPDEHLRLLKFSKPVGGTVRVTFNEVMTERWFKNQKSRVYASIMQVHAQVPH